MTNTKKTRKPVKQKAEQSTEAFVPEKVPEAAPPVPITEPPVKVQKVKLVVEVDDIELGVLETYTKRWNERHEDPAYTPIGPAEFLLFATLKWCEYEERGVVGKEREPGEDDVVPGELDTTKLNPEDDDPEFVEAFVARLGAR